MSDFKDKVITLIKSVPRGYVVSYGQVAAAAGSPRAARQVGWILNAMEDVLGVSKHQMPWWRVVNNEGRISIKGTRFNDALAQKSLLESEGLEISDDLTFDISRYRHHFEID